MSHFSQVDHYIENIKKCLSNEKDKEEFLLFLVKYHENLQQEHKTKTTEKDILKKFERNYSIYYKTTWFFHNFFIFFIFLYSVILFSCVL